MLRMPGLESRPTVRFFLAAPLLLCAPLASLQAQENLPPRKCESPSLPEHLPAADAIIDSALISVVLSQALDGNADGLLVSLRYLDGASTPAMTLLANDSVSADSAQRVLDVLRPHLKPVTLQERNWGVRLRVRGGERPSVQLERSLYCPPVAVERIERGYVTKRVVVGSSGALPPRSAQASRPQTVDAEVKISADGTVTEVNMRRGSGITELDDELLSHMRQRIYRPALLDGVPIPSWERSNVTRMRM